MPINTAIKWIIQLYIHYSILPNIGKKRSGKEKNSPQFIFRFHKYILKVTAVIKFSGRDYMFWVEKIIPKVTHQRHNKRIRSIIMPFFLMLLCDIHKILYFILKQNNESDLLCSCNGQYKSRPVGPEAQARWRIIKSLGK